MLIDNPPVAIRDDLWMLGTRAYPIYLCLGGTEAAIFEGGTGAMASLVAEQSRAVGVEPQSVRQLIVTHAHPDHVMAVPRLRSVFPNLAVVASEIAARTLAAEKAIAFFAQVDEMLTGALLKAGTIREEQRPAALADKQIAVDRVVREGDEIVVGQCRFQVLQTPGHSDCSLSFFEPQRRILLISDATGYYMPEDQSWWPNYFTDYAAYVRSMERLAGLGADVVCLSHNGAISGADDVRAYFEGAIAATRGYHERIIASARQGKSARQIGEELGAEIYPKTPSMPLEFFQKNCGLLAKLSLKHEGIGAEK